MMWQRTKKVLLAFGVAAVVAFVFILGIGIKWLMDANLQFESSLASAQQEEDIIFEFPSKVRRRDIEIFYKFSSSHSEPFEEWLESKEEIGEIGFLNKGRELYIASPFSLGAIPVSNCGHICFHRYFEFGKINTLFWRILIGTEDRRYLDHSGIDLKSILRAIWVDIKAMSLVQGGSTLTQQIVKNLFLSHEKSFKRKLKELFYSFYIEWKYDKEKILETYLNQVYWGSLQGIHLRGFYAASIGYFGKHPDQLSAYEVAILISMLKGPGYYNPYKNADRLKARVETIFKGLKEAALLDGSEKVWGKKRWASWVKSLKRKSYLRRLKALAYSLDPQENSIDQYDRYVLMLANNQVKKDYKLGELDVAMKFGWGQVNCENCRDRFFYSKRERNLKVAIEDEIHSVASTIKPFVYRIFMENGANFSDEVELSPISLVLPGERTWTPKEPAQKYIGDITTLDIALQKSLNRPIIKVAQAIGFETLENGLKEYFPDLKTPLYQFPSQLLGSYEVTISRYLEAYKKFISKECKIGAESLVFHKLLNPNLTTIFKRVHQEVSEKSFFHKTGTANKSFDNWVVLSNGTEVFVVWYGLEQKKKDQKDIRLSGTSTAYRILETFLRYRGKSFPELNCSASSP